MWFYVYYIAILFKVTDKSFVTLDNYYVLMYDYKNVSNTIINKYNTNINVPHTQYIYMAHFLMYKQETMN